MKREFTHLATDFKSANRYLSLLAITCSLLFLINPKAYAEDNSSTWEPCCMIPHDTQVGCDALGYGFDPYDVWQLEELFGSPHSYGSCPNYYVTELTPYVHLNSCELGTITRRFEVINPYDWYSDPIICTQLVEIVGVHDYEIRFPEDEVAYCTTPDPTPIEYNEISCDLLAVSTNDLVFNTATDACYKIFRTYRVINWCEYDGVSPPLVISRDEDCDGVPGDEAVWVQRRANDIVYTDRSSIQFDNIPAYIDLDPSCGHDGYPGYWRRFFVAEGYPYYSSRGFYQYRQIIKVTDNVPPEINYTAPDPFCSLSSNIAAGCPGDVKIPFTIVENCTDQAEIKVFFFEDNVPVPLAPYNDLFDEIVTGNFPNYLISTTAPLGTHSFEIHVNDGCGNSNSILIPFEVVDCKAPAPICIHGLSSSLMPLEPGTDADGDGDVDAGAMAIWANDFIGSDTYDCSGPVTYSINREGETPNKYQDGIVLTCDDRDTAYIEIYAWDNAYNPYAVQPDGTVGGPNYDHCKTYIRLTDNLGLCPDVITEDDPAVVTLLGAVATEEDSMIADVAIYLEGDTSDMMMTETDGHFEFEELELGMSYEIEPQRDGDDAEGLTNQDLLILGKHLMGLDSIDSPYLLIAADVDNSHSIDINDFLILRDLVLGFDTAFHENTSWRFVVENFEFEDDTNPWLDEFPEKITLDSIFENQEDLDFVAIKIGDLDESAMKEESEAELFTQNRELVQLQRLINKAYPEVEELALGIELPNEVGQREAIDWRPSWPNPFKEVTNISFYLPKEARINLSILDLNGRAIQTINAVYSAGEHTERIRLNKSHPAGVYYIRLQSGDQIQTQRIILMN